MVLVWVAGQTGEYVSQVGPGLDEVVLAAWDQRCRVLLALRVSAWQSRVARSVRRAPGGMLLILHTIQTEDGLAQSMVQAMLVSTSRGISTC